MLVFRSLTVGLLGAACLLLATRPPPQTIVTNAPAQILMVPSAAPSEPAVTVVDVAPGVSSEVFGSLIVLAANEHIATIDDVPTLGSAVGLEDLERSSRAYIDVGIVNDANVSRRVLVLLH